MSLQEIKEAVSHLSVEERAEVAACLHRWEDDAWDQQIKKDVAAGKLSNLLSEIDRDIAKGSFRDMP